VRILVEPVIFRFGRCGMTRYYGALVEGLRARGFKVTVPLASSGCDYQSTLSRVTRRFRWIPKAAALLNKVSTVWFRLLLRSKRYDLVLATDPGFSRSLLEHQPDVKFVMVVHDLMTCVVAPDGLYDSVGPALVNLLYLTRRAARVICISDDTRRALLAMAPLEDDRVAVVRTGNLLAAANHPPGDHRLPQRFLLFVGERSGRKGFFHVVRAFSAIAREHPDVVLVCTGTFNWGEIDLLERQQMADRVQAIEADDSTLVQMYKHAICLIYPSLYEGFGLPAIEAMHYGCPVITSDRGALPEICGDAAVVVNPESLTQLASAIGRMLTDRAFAEGYRCRGIAQAAQFSTAKMMDDLQRILEELKCESKGDTTRIS
jgi:glycosyltransferase involved in cell wall biosynthesis